MTALRSLLNVSLLLPVLLLSLPWMPTSASSSGYEDNFFQCLLNLSQPSHPITSAIFAPDNASYSSVLQSYIRNLRFNMSSTPKPLLIVTALHESHVQASVVCAWKHGLQMKIRSGGHDYEGVSYVSDVPFFVLDMFNLRAVDVDVETETAWVQAGAILGEVYYRIAEKSKVHGFPAGICPTVGVGGHLSGGGYGNMMRKYGLSADNIIDAQLVDVNGRLLDRKSMGEDLFWAIRGGGGASFGVVISYKINIVRVPEVVTVFRVQRTLEQNATDIVDKWQHVAYNLDDDIFIRLTLEVVNATQGNGKTVRATFRCMFLGDSARLLATMKESFPEMGLVQSDCLEMSWLESVLFWTDFAVGTPTTALLRRTPPSITYLKRKSDYVKKPIPRDGLEKLWQKMVELQVPSLAFNPYGGKMGEIPSTALPFPHRAGNLWKIQYATNWNVEGTEAANHYIDLTRQLYDFMTPYVSKDPREAFLNYRDLDLGINHNDGKKKSYLEGRTYGIQYFKENFDRLVQVKTKVDPGNFFRNEQSIPTFPYWK
ncbi:Reticuline oxidase precursor, putative [Ricinus communis]|uniref:Reticuline oxidase, putative n=1 Tax=Ricinus communis TaxID=3988 RepID=B9SAZ1_RICCO|nr:Reticuline oxidase precursor, putative [Ricinus communis]|eukprot:XP_002523151.1 berberine bridge enzyme-like 8 [Ricinus communis]